MERRAEVAINNDTGQECWGLVEISRERRIIKHIVNNFIMRKLLCQIQKV
jgi:hypothetical protein